MLEGHLGLRAEAGAQQEGPSVQVHEVDTSLRGLWSKGAAVELTSLKVCASSFLQHRPLLFLIFLINRLNMCVRLCVCFSTTVCV